MIPRSDIGPGLSVSRIVTGLWQIADMERTRPVDIETVAAALRPFIAAGFTSFDMADHYGSAERVAGRLARMCDGPIELLTKWVPSPGPATRDEVRAAVERALDRLRVPAIDLMQFHAWHYFDPRWLDRLFWLNELRREGLIRHLAVTNFDTAHLRIALASGIPIVSNQVCLSLLDRRATGRMAALCREHGVRLLAYGTLAGGLLTEAWLGRPEPDVDRLETWSQMKYARFVRAAGGWPILQRIAAAVAAVARRHDVSMANIACRWALDQPGVAAIIVGARPGRSTHVDDNRRVFDVALTDRDRTELEGALAEAAPIPGDCGDEYRRAPYLTAAGDLSHHLDRETPPFQAGQRAAERAVVLTGTIWEPLAGFARAVRTGNRIVVSGTTATHGERMIGGADPSAQTHFIIDKIEGALRTLGGQLSDVIRTRVYIQRMEDWESVARAHGERFGDVLPANTMIRADLIGDGYLVEIEAEAIIAEPSHG